MKMRAKHYWRYAVREKHPGLLAEVVCDAAGTIAMISKTPQAELSCFDRWIAFLTILAKRLGISGWKETGCSAEVRGTPVRDAQHSTDGFWTIDVRLESLAIGTAAFDPSKPGYLRIEVEPGRAAHDVCAQTRIVTGMILSFGGPVVIDTDGPFLEIHPDKDFQIV